MQIVQITNKNKNHFSYYRNYYFGIVLDVISKTEYDISIRDEGRVINQFALKKECTVIK